MTELPGSLDTKDGAVTTNSNRAYNAVKQQERERALEDDYQYNLIRYPLEPPAPRSTPREYEIATQDPLPAVHNTTDAPTYMNVDREGHIEEREEVVYEHIPGDK